MQTEENIQTEEKRPAKKMSNITLLSIVHGLYFLLAGIWPVIHMSSFIAVTGPKIDLWLVRTVGMLVFFIGAGLLGAAAKKEITFPMILVIVGSSLSLMFIDVIYVWQNVISPIYLLDAIAELVLVTCWVVFLYQSEEYELFYRKQV